MTFPFFKRVIIESPYRANDINSLETHKAYLKVAMMDSIMRGEAPCASHKLYTDIFNDDDENERKLGIELGFAWLQAADLVAFYVDFGFSAGMSACLVDPKTHRFRLPYEIRRVKEDVLSQLR